MPYVSTLAFWFAGLLFILIIGFWKTYFSVFFDGPDRAHHFHGLAMLAWVLLLINQAWLMRSRKIELHRMTGRLSYVIAPLVVVSGIVVTFFNIARFEDPMLPRALSIFHLGLYSVLAFAILYGLAMFHRREPQYHARYMIGTALVFLVPGLSRAMAHFVEPTGLPSLTFYQNLWVPLGIGLLLIVVDWRGGRVRSPFVVFSVIWAINLALWHLLPHVPFWRAFTAWSASVGGALTG